MRLETAFARAAATNTDGTVSRQNSLFVPGRNCWKLETAERAAAIVDGEAYFAHLESALLQAKRSILIIGWDFDSTIRLRPGDETSPLIGDFLRSLVERQPELDIHILVWSIAVLHAPSPPLSLLLSEPWQEHPRIHFRLDTQHPFYAAHHQKIVAIDDALAFVGGMDLTNGRFDTTAHASNEPRRQGRNGAPADPVHDVQLAVTGDAARVLASVARDRWHNATGETLVTGIPDGDRWPDGLIAGFRNQPVAVARTLPTWRRRPPVVEVQAMIRDMLRATQRHLYIEAQYLTARYVRKALLELLSRPDGAEIVIVLNWSSEVMVERVVMGQNCDRMIRALRKADHHKKLQVFYPVVPTEPGDGHDGAERQVHIHSKLLIIDDRLIRIGSANLNNRSVGLDTECDAALEAASDDERGTIAALRNSLIAEHMNAAPEQVAALMAETGSMLRTIERLNVQPRGLREFPVTEGSARFVFGTRFLDPERPFEPGWFLRRRPAAAALVGKAG